MLSWWYNCTRNTSCIYYPKKNFLKLDENSSWNDKKFIPHYVYFDHIITFFQICKQMCVYIRICHPINLCVYFPFVPSSRLSRCTGDKKSCCQCRRHKRCNFSPWVGKIQYSRKWQPTPVLLPGKFNGQRSLVGYSQGYKESDMTEWLSTHIPKFIIYLLSQIQVFYLWTTQLWSLAF